MESNVQKMREVLQMMTSLFDNGVICTSYANTPEEIEQIEELYRKAKSALAIPLRNCNVGTAEEQEKRFNKFCDAHKWVDDEGVNACSAYCPLYKTTECALHWAQMPYEEGGAK